MSIPIPFAEHYVFSRKYDCSRNSVKKYRSSYALLYLLVGGRYSLKYLILLSYF